MNRDKALSWLNPFPAGKENGFLRGSCNAVQRGISCHLQSQGKRTVRTLLVRLKDRSLRDGQEREASLDDSQEFLFRDVSCLWECRRNDCGKAGKAGSEREESCHSSHLFLKSIIRKTPVSRTGVLMAKVAGIYICKAAPAPERWEHTGT